MEIISDSDFKVELKSKIIGLKEQLTLNEQRYFHINTVENYVFFLDEIKSNEDKIWVYTTLSQYFLDSANYTTSIDRKKSQELFLKYLDKLTDYYQTNFGFVLIINQTLFASFFLLLFLICYFILGIFFSLIPVTIYLLLTIRTYKKLKEKKVYSIFY